MKKMILLIALVFLGCSNDESFSGKPYIYRWQENEPSCPDIVTDCEITDDFSVDLQKILIQQWGKVIYEADENSSDYWKTSCRTIEDEYGDCEDFAIAAYRAIIDSCLSDFYDIDPRIRVVKPDDSSQYHVLAIVYYEDIVYEIEQFFSVPAEKYKNIILELDMNTIF